MRKAKEIHVTNHAILRWRQRVSEDADVPSILEKAKKSKIVKHSSLPFTVVLLENVVYSFYKDETHEIIFIFEPVNITEFKLLTIYTKTMEKIGVTPPRENYIKKLKRRFCKKDKPILERKETKWN